MKIEIWSDFACPFCYIGKKHFEAALEQFEHKDSVEIIFKSFELDPHSPKKIDHDVHDMLSIKYGMSRRQAIVMNENIRTQAAASDLTFHLDTLKLTNTFDAHRLMQYAATKGKVKEMTQALFQAYFTDSQHLGTQETLLQLALKVGLNRNAVVNLLAGTDYSDKVRADEEEAKQLGITGVPFFIIDRKYTLSGAQTKDTFLQALQTGWKESQILTQLDESKPSGHCTDGSCSIG